MDQQAEPAERRLAFDPGDEIVRYSDPLQSRAEHELAGVKHEHAIVGDRDQFGQVFEVLLDIDDAGRVIAKHPEQIADLDIDRRRLDAALVEGLDQDAVGRNFLAEGSVGQDHGTTLMNAQRVRERPAGYDRSG